MIKIVFNKIGGFTLVELMVVVMIIAILVAVAIPLYGTITRHAERRSVEANLRTIEGAIIKLHAATNEYEVPIAPQPGNSGNLMGVYLAKWPEGPRDATYSIIMFPEESGIYRAGVTTGENGFVGIVNINNVVTIENLPWKINNIDENGD